MIHRIILLLILPTLSFAYEIEQRTPFTCSVNPAGFLLPTERFDNEPESIARTIELVEETQDYVTHRCYFTDRYNYVEPIPDPTPDPVPDPIPDPVPDPASGLLYTDLVRAPIGAPITGFCVAGTETKPATANMTLCGESFTPEITNGQVIFANPPDIPMGTTDDVIVLSAGTYTETVSCGGRPTSWCGDGNDGVSVIGDTSGPMPVLAGVYDCGQSPSGVSGITIANVELGGVSCARRGTKTDTRFVNLYCHDQASSNSGACGNWGTTVKLRVFGFVTENTGVDRKNTAHSLYNQGRGRSADIEFGWITVRNHIGGAGFAVYGHTAGEVIEDIYIHDMLLDNACQLQNCLNIAATDGQSGQAPELDSWIDSVRVERVQCINGSNLGFIGTNLNGGQDWNLKDSECPVNSRMGGDPSTWVKVTNNTGPVTGNTQ